MRNQEMLRITMKQSAEDIGCKADDFLLSDNVTVPFQLGANARKYLKEPITCNLVSYGNNGSKLHDGTVYMIILVDREEPDQIELLTGEEKARWMSHSARYNSAEQ